jgi:death-on-curing family protein
MNKNMRSCEEAPKGGIIIYQTKDKQVNLEVRLEQETVWLNQKQIANLFGTQRPAITKHLNNIFKSKELIEKSVCSILEHTAKDGKTYRTQFYNLDAIVSVGYRVNSHRAAQFRIWATRVLKEHILRGYTLNQKRLLEQTKEFRELQKTIAFIEAESHKELLQFQTKELLSIINEYTKALTIFDQYDRKQLILQKAQKPTFILTYIECRGIICKMKEELIKKKEASDLFGQESGRKLEGVIGNLYQTFGGQELYRSVEEKAAHLLYFLVKDHPLIDGNKRIASILFIYFLEKNNYLLKENGERKINDNALIALTLLIATSEPREKEVMIKIITNLLR